MKSGLCVRRAVSLPSEFPLCILQDICSVYLLGLLGKSSVELNCLPRKEDVKEERPH